MTFFANSGVAWPKYEKDTRHAGAESLDAFSSIWRLLADLERSDQFISDHIDLEQSAESLEQAAGIYTRIADDLQHIEVEPMTPAELDLAGINLSGPRLYSERYYLSDSYYGLFLNNGISYGLLYRELAQRAANLASSIRAFEPRRAKSDLAPQVFQFMKQIEALAVLGRVVAVLNQRKPRKRR